MDSAIYEARYIRRYMQSLRDTWLERSKQRWKLQAAQFVLVGGTAFGVLLFLQGTWPESFYGAILGIIATPVAAVMASSVRCVVCGHRVALNAPFGRWGSYMEALGTCPECGDDGTGRPVAPGTLPVWFQAARDLAARERAGARVRRRKIAGWVVSAMVVIWMGIGVSTCGRQ